LLTQKLRQQRFLVEGITFEDDQIYGEEGGEIPVVPHE
jgi:hypothetical protein